jgi:hypothetical protein
LAFLLLSSAASSFAQISGTEAAIYDHFYPTYAEFCAGTETEVYGKKIETGYGHATLFLKGACLDRSVPYPRLKLCQGGGGVAVSVIPQFSNINWIGIGGRDMFFHAHVPYGAPYGQADQDRVIQSAISHGVFSNVRLTAKDAAAIPAKYHGDMVKWAANLTFGICFGQSLVRTTHCIRVPMPSGVMAEVIKSLNQRNEYYFATGKEYKWFGLTDNCVRPLHNALAVAGFWKPKPEGWIMPFALLQITTPANDYLNAVQHAFLKPVPDLPEILDSPALLSNLMEHDWLPFQSGTLLETIPFHSFENTMWHTKPELDFARVGPFPDRIARVHRYEEQPRLNNLRLNLLAFQKRYQEIKSQLDCQPLNLSRDKYASIRAGGKYGLGQIKARYGQYIAKQLSDIETKLADPLLP